MHGVTSEAGERLQERQSNTSFGEWASVELDRLIRMRAAAPTPQERAQVELQIAAVYDMAQRFGRSLADTAEL